MFSRLLGEEYNIWICYMLDTFCSVEFSPFCHKFMFPVLDVSSNTTECLSMREVNACDRPVGINHAPAAPITE